MYRPSAPPAHQRPAVAGRQLSRHSGNSDHPRPGIHSHSAPLPTPCCYRRSSATSRCRRVAGLGATSDRVCIGAEEVGDDLDVLPKETLKKRGFGAGGLPRGSPRSGRSAWAGRQASIALRPDSVAHRKCGVSHRWRNNRGSSRSRHGLRLRLGAHGERGSDGESDYKQSLQSRSSFMLMNSVVH